MSEAHIQRAILIALGSRADCRVWRSNTGVAKYQRADGSQRSVAFGVVGQADVQGVLRLPCGAGIYLGIELKSAGKGLRPAQQTWGTVLATFGGLFMVAPMTAEAAVRGIEEALAAGPAFAAGHWWERGRWGPIPPLRSAEAQP